MVLYVQTYLSVVLNQNTVLSKLVSITFYGGELDGVSFNNQQQLKYARRAQLGVRF
jgi:hypothetical protein